MAAGVPVEDIPIVENRRWNSKTEWPESLYLQDEWKLIPDFTVNYGLRFDRFTAYTGKHIR